MNAPLPAGVSRPPKREDYEPIVKGLRPLVDGEELDLRCSLLLMRDRAIATKNTVSAPAWQLLDVVQCETSDNALNWRVDIEGLRELRRLCANCIAAAASFEALYNPKQLAVDKAQGEDNGRV
jgi:hypothetical protein